VSTNATASRVGQRVALSSRSEARLSMGISWCQLRNSWMRGRVVGVCEQGEVSAAGYNVDGAVAEQLSRSFALLWDDRSRVDRDEQDGLAQPGTGRGRMVQPVLVCEGGGSASSRREGRRERVASANRAAQLGCRRIAARRRSVPALPQVPRTK